MTDQELIKELHRMEDMPESLDNERAIGERIRELQAEARARCLLNEYSVAMKDIGDGYRIDVTILATDETDAMIRAEEAFIGMVAEEAFLIEEE